MYDICIKQVLDFLLQEVMSLSARGYRQAAIGVASGLVAICISVMSLCPMSLLFLEFIKSNSRSKFCKASLVFCEILTSLRGTCLCTCSSLGIINDEIQGSCFF